MSLIMDRTLETRGKKKNVVGVQKEYEKLYLEECKMMRLGVLMEIANTRDDIG